MAISINGVTVAGIGKDGKNGTDGKDATINGVNALNIETTGGIKGTQSGDTYTIDGSSILTESKEYSDNLISGIFVRIDDDEGIVESGTGEIILDKDLTNKLLDVHCVGISLFHNNNGTVFYRVYENGYSLRNFYNLDGNTGVYKVLSVSLSDNKLLVSIFNTFVDQWTFNNKIGNINTLLDQINGEVV